ncbi:MAG: hypothetical protein JO250_21010 [Armatimonadetes bacterium]|nr:hypothetical protein [Armatimonadota bacterium]
MKKDRQTRGAERVRRVPDRERAAEAFRAGALVVVTGTEADGLARVIFSRRKLARPIFDDPRGEWRVAEPLRLEGYRKSSLMCLVAAPEVVNAYLAHVGWDEESARTR